MKDTKDNTENLAPILEKTEIASLEHRLKNVEKISSTIESVVEKGVESWSHYLEKKNEEKKHEINILNEQHKRGSKILLTSIVFIFILLIIAMLKDQYELVKVILGLGLSVAAGSGLTTLFKK